jgi:cysteine synthase A
MIGKGTPGPHKIQGIGANFVPRNLDRSVVKDIISVPSQAALDAAKNIARAEGLFLGISASANVLAAIDYAKAHPGSKVVAIAPDGGDKYVSMGIYD